MRAVAASIWCVIVGPVRDSMCLPHGARGREGGRGKCGVMW